jgi:hypothetical protein
VNPDRWSKTLTLLFCSTVKQQETAITQELEKQT